MYVYLRGKAVLAKLDRGPRDVYAYFINLSGIDMGRVIAILKVR